MTNPPAGYHGQGLTAADAQAIGAHYHAQGGPIELQGANHSAERIMFTHGAMTGHATCGCPVIDEHGHNVNPGRVPLETDRTNRPHLPAAREKAGATYDRRRARRAADTLATTPVERWDHETRKIIATLATMCAPSRITDVLDATFADTYDRAAIAEAAERNSGEHPKADKPRECHDPECTGLHVGPWSVVRGHARDTTPSPLCGYTTPSPVHDNGDYRA